ncbi:MAG: hypothetical protein L6W00_03515 [Lentisphaeria bacterium]|nr:MAG: hypothetical protein L6W00_03515 [Lentisphaeria bacterium]
MPYAVMEYADGGTLRRRLEHGIFPFSQAIHLLRSMLLALTELHHHGVVHRDIKPDNIWFVSDGGIRLGTSAWRNFPGSPRSRAACSEPPPTCRRNRRGIRPQSTAGAISTASRWCSSRC